MAGSVLHTHICSFSLPLPGSGLRLVGSDIVIGLGACDPVCEQRGGQTASCTEIWAMMGVVGERGRGKREGGLVTSRR